MKEIEDEFAGKVKTDKAYGTAVEELFKTFYRPLCNYAYIFLKDIDESEDIVQAVFYQLWKNRETTEISTSIKSYLFTAVRNNCLKKISHIKIRNQYKENVLYNSERTSDNTMDKVTSKELEEQIKKAVEELPTQCGLIFKLSRQGGLKYAEIADSLNISIKTVENQMGKALKVLRGKLKNYLALLIYFLINNLNR